MESTTTMESTTSTCLQAVRTSQIKVETTLDILDLDLERKRINPNKTTMTSMTKISIMKDCNQTL